jgi:aspartokinase-like uncharacterized kinase
VPDVPLRFIKLGGSLLDLPNLADIFRHWIATQCSADNVMIVGGGAMADVIRQMDRVHRLGEERSHWLCIHILDVTARMVAELLPEAVLTARLDDDEARQAGRLRILQPFNILNAGDGLTHKRPMPHNWDVTSDSVAAWFAYAFGASELVLLKSRSVVSGHEKRDDEEIVDPYFKIVARGIESIRCINLRDPEFPETKISY